ncbi:3TM-type holin [Thalassospira sp. MCCC 1A01428]|uniref:3TM-type holin n=1 Tax=Thalassospira sp. MCCC 1A01428 TaxID=1470575 RepID=UPI000A200481|nr:3TM-type holin [Thalassospira sp. MCCC 1A01428]
MNWSELGKTLAQSAPLVGTALLGPAGGAIGAGLAALFGTDSDPDKIAQALNASPDAVIKLRQFELEHQSELTKAVIAAGTADIASVNSTMTTEAQSDHWWVSGWRPFWGFASATAWAFLAGCLGIAILRGDGVGIALSVFNAVPETFWLIPLAVLGIASWHRGKEKRARVEGGAWGTKNSLVDGVISKLKGDTSGR